jgi:hypothetical protein
MRYWPISTIRSWPCLTPATMRALDAAAETRELAPVCYRACIRACNFVPAAPVHGLVLIRDEGSLPKHAFLKRPEAAELWHLERFCMCENFDGEMFLMVSALH